MTRYSLALTGNVTTLTPIAGRVDLTSLRIALQVAGGAVAPFALSGVLGGLIGDVATGAGFVIGGAFGTALIWRTLAEAEQLDREQRAHHRYLVETLKLDLAERKAKLPKPTRVRRQSSVARLPEPSAEEQDAANLALDARFLFEMGIRRGTFARGDYIVTGQERIAMPSGESLSRPYFERIIAALMDDGLLVKGLNGSPQLPPMLRDGGQAGRQEAGKDDMPIFISAPKRGRGGV